MIRSRENVFKTLNHQQPHRIPYVRSYNADVLAMLDSMNFTEDVREYYKYGDFSWITIPDFHEDKSIFHQYHNRTLPDNAVISDFGFVKIPKKSEEGNHAGYDSIHPLADDAVFGRLKEYPWPDYSAEKFVSALTSRVNEAKKNEFVSVGNMSQTTVEMGYELRGIEKILMDFYANPEQMGDFLDIMRTIRVVQARQFARAGCDILRIGDDIASQTGLIIDPEIYREHIKPVHAAIINAAREIKPDMHVLYHSDGNIEAILDDLVEIGITAINPAQAECMDLATLKGKYGHQLTFWGCCSTQSMYESGNGDAVEKELWFLKENIAKNGGMVIDHINMLSTDGTRQSMKRFYQVFFELAKF